MHVVRTQGTALIDPDKQYSVQHHHCSLRSRVANNITQLTVKQILHTRNAVIESGTGNVLEYSHLVKVMEKRTWIKALANYLWRLAQGIGKRIPSGTNTIFFIKHSDVPANRNVSYVRLVASIHTNKTETHRVSITLGGDVIDYPGSTSIDTYSLTTTSILLNSVISNLDAIFTTLEIKHFYYNNPLNRFEYVWMALLDIPEEVIMQYHPEKLASHGWIYI